MSNVMTFPAMAGGIQGGDALPWPLVIAQFIQMMDPIYNHRDTISDAEFAKQRHQPDLDKYKNNLSNKIYLNVAGRLVWFKEIFPKGAIFSFPLEIDSRREYTRLVSNPRKPQEQIEQKVYGYAHYVAIAFSGRGDVGYGEKTECVLDFKDYAEKAQTGAIGRALLTMGIGTQFADAEVELNEGHRIVDSPIPAAPAAPAAETTVNKVQPVAAAALQNVASKLPPEKRSAVVAAIGTPARTGQTPVETKAQRKAKEAPAAAPVAVADAPVDAVTGASIPDTIEECKEALGLLNNRLGHFGFKEMRAVRNMHPELKVLHTIKVRDWSLEHWQGALRFTLEWMDQEFKQWDNQEPTQEMKDALENSRTANTPGAIAQYAWDMYGLDDYTKMNKAQVNALLIDLPDPAWLKK